MISQTYSAQMTKAQRLDFLRALDEKLEHGDQPLTTYAAIPEEVVADIRAYQGVARIQVRQEQAKKALEANSEETKRQEMIRIGDLARTNPSQLAIEIQERMDAYARTNAQKYTPTQEPRIINPEMDERDI